MPVNSELATRADLDLLRAEQRAEIAVLRTGLTGEMGELKVEMAELRAELAEHREATTAAISKVSKALDKLRAELYRAFLPLVGLVVAVASFLTRWTTGSLSPRPSDAAGVSRLAARAGRPPASCRRWSTHLRGCRGSRGGTRRSCRRPSVRSAARGTGGRSRRPPASPRAR